MLGLPASVNEELRLEGSVSCLDGKKRMGE